MPYAVSVNSSWPPGEHKVTVDVEFPKGQKLAQQTYTLTIVNPDYGKPPVDADVEALKGQFAGSTVALLQQGAPVPAWKVDKYGGTQDCELHAPNAVPDRNLSAINFGGSTLMQVGQYGMDHRTLVKFDLAQVPKTATVQKVLLKLQLRDGAALGLKAQRVLTSWAQGIGIGDLYDPKVGKIRDGEPSWDLRAFPKTAWGAPGCGKAGVDFDPKEVLSACTQAKTPNDKVAKAWVTWDLTEFAAIWVKTPEQNFGVVLLGHDPISNFRSSEYEDPIFRPKLIVVYK